MRTLLTPIRTRLSMSLGSELALLPVGHGTAGAETAHRPGEPRTVGDMEWHDKLLDKSLHFQVVHVALGAGVKQLINQTQQVAVGTTGDLERRRSELSLRALPRFPDSPRPTVHLRPG